MPRPQRLRSSRQRQTERALRAYRVRELAVDTLGDERVHVAGGVQPAVRERRVGDASMPNELAEVRLDSGSLREAHEMRDYGHAVILLVSVTPLRLTSWNRQGSMPSSFTASFMAVSHALRNASYRTF
jgi:hypothetical protein